jgi:hypothetical protein
MIRFSDFRSPITFEIEPSQVERILRPGTNEPGAIILLADGRWRWVKEGPRTSRMLLRDARRHLARQQSMR